MNPLGSLLLALAGFMTACDPPASQGASGDADTVRYWDLPTGSRLAYVHLPGRGPGLRPLVYLHGGPGAYEVDSFDHYRPFAEAWAHLGYDVYFFDQVGSGRSLRLADPAQYTVARHVADLEAIRVVLQADRFVLIGESWGATLAAHYAAAHPDRVDRMVIVAPGLLDRADWETPRATPRFDPEMLAWVRAHRGANAARLCAEVDSLLRRDVAAAYRRVGDAALDTLMDAWVTQVLPTAVHDSSRVRGATMAGMGWWAWTMTGWDHLARAPRVRPRLRRLDRPVLILAGVSDYLPRAIAEEYAATFPRATVRRIPAAGHLIWLDQPALYARAIGTFLAADAAP